MEGETDEEGNGKSQGMPSLRKPEEKGQRSWEGTCFDRKTDTSSNMTGGTENAGVCVGYRKVVLVGPEVRRGQSSHLMASIFSVKCEVRMVTTRVGKSYISGLKRANVISYPGLWRRGACW